MGTETEDILNRVNNLVDAWCERRNIIALKYVLQGWPLAQGLTDEWVNLLESLKMVRDWGSSSVTPEESETIRRLINEIDAMLNPY